MVVDQLPANDIRVARLMEPSGIEFGYIAVDSVEVQWSKGRWRSKEEWKTVERRCRLSIMTPPDIDDFYMDDEASTALGVDLFHYRGNVYKVVWLEGAAALEVQDTLFLDWP